MRHWFRDGPLRAVIRNAGYLLSGKAAGALLGLIALACAGRGMTPALFGTLMIVHTYAQGAGALTKFQTWQVIIRNGGPALERGDTGFVRDTIRFAFGLDLASGLAGMVAAMALLPVLAPHFGLDGAQWRLALAYCTLVPTMTAATPVGVLRLLDRFDLIGAQQMLTPLLRAGGALLSYAGGLGFVGFVVSWYVADLAGDLLTWTLAARELRRRGMLDAFRPGLFGVGRRLPGVWRFVWVTNVAHSVYAAWGPLGNLVVAAVLGPAPAGLFKIASTLMDSTSKPADLINRGFFPEIMRLDPRSRAPWRLGLRVSALSAAIGLALVLAVLIGGRPLIGAVFGHRYLPAYPILQVMTWTLLISTAAFPLEPLLYMADRQGAALAAQLAAQLAAALGYLVLIGGLIRRYGLPGAGYAFLVGTSAGALMMLALAMQSYAGRKRLRSHAPSDIPAG